MTPTVKAVATGVLITVISMVIYNKLVQPMIEGN